MNYELWIHQSTHTRVAGYAQLGPFISLRYISDWTPIVVHCYYPYP